MLIMVNQRVWTSLKTDDCKRLNDKAKEQKISSYELSRKFIIDGLDPNKRTSLKEYSTKELLQEIWRRIP